MLNDKGTFVRHIEKEMDALFTFLTKEGVEATSNVAERMTRFGVLWRKRSQDTDSDKRKRWIKRIFFLRQTCLCFGKTPLSRCSLKPCAAISEDKRRI